MKVPSVFAMSLSSTPATCTLVPLVEQVQGVSLLPPTSSVGVCPPPSSPKVGSIIGSALRVGTRGCCSGRSLRGATRVCAESNCFKLLAELCAEATGVIPAAAAILQRPCHGGTAGKGLE